MAVSTTANVDGQTKTWYDRTLLEAAQESLFHNRWGQKRNIPTREGKTISFNRHELLDSDPSTHQLTEGVTPPSDTIDVTTVTAALVQYGAWVEVSDVLNWTGIDPVLTQAVKNQGYQAGEMIDKATRDVLAAGTTVRYAGNQAGRTSVTSADKINGEELRKLRRTLRNNKAKPIPGIDAFAMIISPYTHYDLQAMPEWLAQAEFSVPEDLRAGMVKRMWGFAFYETSLAKVFSAGGSGGIDVHASVAIGRNAYGVTSLEGHAMESIRKPLGSAGTADPLEQRGTAGWKAMHIAVILNQNFIARLEHAVSS